MTIKWNNKECELQGGSAWNRDRFAVLKQMNPKGKVVVIENHGKQERYLVPIGECEIVEEPRNY